MLTFPMPRTETRERVEQLEERLRAIAVSLDDCVSDYHWLLRHDNWLEAQRVLARKALLETERNTIKAELQSLTTQVLAVAHG